MLRKTFALFFCVIMLTVALFTDVTAAENKEEKVTQFSEIQSVSEENSYKNYKESIKEFTAADTEIVIDAKDYTEGSTVKLIQGDLYGENSGIIFENSGDKAVYSFNVDADGIYNIKVDYAAIEKTTMDIQMAVYIDGKILWDDLEKIELFRWWKDATKVWNLDKEGNEVPPEQIEAFGFREQYLFDVSGLEADYYQFYFSKGSHTIEFLLKQEPVAFKQITLTAPQNLEKASEVVKKIKAKDYTGDDLIIQGEAAFEKSSFSLAPKSDSLSADVQPQSPYKNVINYIGATTWDSPWQTLKWQVDIGEAAFYKLGFHFKQSAVVNADVYRDIKIDGKAPFSEAKEYSFGYDSDWQYKTLNNNDGKPCKIFLDEGIHTIELSVTLGPTAEYIRRLENILEVIGDEYLTEAGDPQYFTTEEKNLRVEDGKLVMHADYDSNGYYGSEIRTDRSLWFKYGLAEIKCKYNNNDGLVSAFWLLGMEGTGDAHGEIDVFESYAFPNKLRTTSIAWAHDNHTKFSSDIEYGDFQPSRSEVTDMNSDFYKKVFYELDEGDTFDDEWHTIGCEWDADAIRWVMDGRVFLEIDTNANERSIAAFHGYMQLILTQYSNINVFPKIQKDASAATDWKNNHFTIDKVTLYQLPGQKIKKMF